MVSGSLEPNYSEEFACEIQQIFGVTGLDRLAKMELAGQRALMKVIVSSMPKWGIRWSGLKTISIKKIGVERHIFRANSPLLYALEELRWLVLEPDEGIETLRPKDRWYIPLQALIGGAHQFVHLRPLVPTIASLIERTPSGTESLVALGLPRYESDTEISDTNQRLLVDLANTLSDEKN